MNRTDILYVCGKGHLRDAPIPDDHAVPWPWTGRECKKYSRRLLGYAGQNLNPYCQEILRPASVEEEAKWRLGAWEVPIENEEVTDQDAKSDRSEHG